MDFQYADGMISYSVGEEVKAKITFPATGDGTIWDIDHIFVDESLRGQGIANQLLAEVVRLAQERHMQLKITCPFAQKVFAKTPEYQALEVKY